jgi:hypothetical protein
MDIIVYRNQIVSMDVSVYRNKIVAMDTAVYTDTTMSTNKMLPTKFLSTRESLKETDLVASLTYRMCRSVISSQTVSLDWI